MSIVTLGLVPLGILAGVLTTLSGQGGGLMLVLVLAWLVGPHAALALSTPALFLGNLHRSYLCRLVLDRRLALLISLGVVPGAYLGGRFASAASAFVLQCALVVVTGLAIAKAMKWLRFEIPRPAFLPAGAGIGFLAGTSGGAGVLLGPLVHSTGLRGQAFVGTVAVVAVALHAGRLVAYGGSGLLTLADLPRAAVLASGIFLGNFLADRLRPRLGEKVTGRLELWTLVGCAFLSVAGVR